MAHKSRLAGFMIDCQGGDLGQAAAFWSQAIGTPTAGTDLRQSSMTSTRFRPPRLAR